MTEIKNLEEFQRELERLREALEQEATGGLRDDLRDTVHRALLLLGTYAADYPPQPAGSSYRRRRELGRAWTSAQPRVTVSGHVLEARIENAMPYARKVQKEGEQRPVHRGRWQTTEDVVREHVGKIEPMIAQVGLDVVERVADSVG
jgi:hypothetical protein